MFTLALHTDFVHHTPATTITAPAASPALMSVILFMIAVILLFTAAKALLQVLGPFWSVVWQLARIVILTVLAVAAAFAALSMAVAIVGPASLP